MEIDPDSPEGQLQALERFVVENTDLAALEERIGRFNIFDALRVARTEIRHSNFLAWLLDPAESHGQGALFLTTILMDLLRQAPANLRPLNPVELDGAELRGVEIRREWRNIDLLIVCKEPAFVVAIENKVGASEHGDQLKQYQAAVATEYPTARPLFVFLTIAKDEPSEPDWVPYSYADLHRVLERCRKTNARSIGDDVLAFLDHYLRLIGSRFMDDPEIDELCQRIYRNHRQALDLIFERVAPGSAVLADLADLLKEPPGRWHEFNRTTQRIDFVPASWLAWLPALSALPKSDARAWITWQFHVIPGRSRLLCVIGPCTDTAWRRRAIERLAARSDELGFKSFPDPRKIANKWTTLSNEILGTWDEDKEPNSALLAANTRRKLDRVFERVAAVPELLRPILGEARAPASDSTPP